MHWKTIIHGDDQPISSVTVTETRTKLRKFCTDRDEQPDIDRLIRLVVHECIHQHGIELEPAEVINLIPMEDRADVADCRPWN